MIRVHIIVKGTVQGVGYRFFTRSLARKFKLGGFVRNLPDRSVEAEAQGEKDDVARFLTELRAGHHSSHVTSLEVEEMATGNYDNNFEIRF